MPVAVSDGVKNTTITNSTVAVGATPVAVAVNPVTNQIYVTNNTSNDVTVIDGATNTTTRVAAGTQPFGVAVNPVTNKIYVANKVSNNVTGSGGATNAPTTAPTAKKPTGGGGAAGTEKREVKETA